MLKIIGMGLSGLGSMTIDGLSALRSCEIAYYDSYTSILPDGAIEDISRAAGREIIPANRYMLENSNEILQKASESDICLLVAGDPLSATTHFELIHEAMARGIDVDILSNASVILFAPLILGLYVYRIGPPVSLPFVDDKFFPLSPYRKIKKNLDNGFHTLVLLDLRDGKNMTVPESLSILRRMEEKVKDGLITDDRFLCIVSRAGRVDQTILCGRLGDLENANLSDPVSLVIPAELSDQERVYISGYVLQNQ
ncbi:MAG: diphthine synthase [Thermoplasmataceae archaeon]|jgi:diphthine synthase